VDLPDGQEIMTLAFCFWHNNGVWQTNSRTDTLLSQRSALA